MTLSTSRRRAGAATAAVVGLSAVTLALATANAQAANSSAGSNPYSPTYQHTYRHGAVPTLKGKSEAAAWAGSHTANAATAAAATGADTLSYGGGIDGVGVNSGHAQVYLVYYGTQWGTQGTDGNGNATFSGDPDGAAPVTQQMFKGIGTGGELWSADLTQWCDGPNVASGAVSCPSNAAFIPYQTGGVLSGVWYDNSAASPSGATGHQLGQEAVNAAAHFGNTTAASNRNAYYIILSPHGTDPDGYQDPNTGYCAWHDYNGDSSLSGGPVSSPYGDIAFSNQPYNMDAGQNCGVGFVNGSSGTLDGYTMTLGHEWHEMMSDMYPAGGWTNHVSGSAENGEENSDECAWLSPGTAGGAANVAMGTGTFAEQASWSNDTNACAISHPIVGGSTGSDTVTVTAPATQSTTVNTAASLQIKATDSASGQTLTYSATGLPAGLSISASGLISGTPTTVGSSSVKVTATDSTKASGSATFTWNVTSASGGGGCTAAQLITNGGFETGSATPWTLTAGVLNSSSSEPAHAGSYDAWLDGYGSKHTDTAAQTVTIPSTCTSASFSFWLHIDTAKTGTTAKDTLNVQVLNSSGTVLATLATFSNANAASGYTQHTYSLASYAGQKVTLKFTGAETGNGQTSFVLDDNTLNVD